MAEVAVAENCLKYAAENYGIDKVQLVHAAVDTNTKMIDNPARKAANATIRQADKNLAAAREDYAAMLADPAIPAIAKNTRLILPPEEYTKAEKALAAAQAAPPQDPGEAAR